MIDSFLSFEEKEDLFQIEINGIKFWHLIRFDMCSEILTQSQDLLPAHRSNSSNPMQKKLSFLRRFKNSITNNPYFNLKERDILIFNHQRKIKDGKVYKCLYTSELADNLNNTYYVYEDMYNGTHLTPSYEKNIKYTDQINLEYNFKKISDLIFSKNRLDVEDKNYINKLVEKVNKTFLVNLNSNYWIKLIDDRLLFHEVALKSYNRILTKTNPKVILEVVSYSSHKYALNSVAKNLSIPTIELQHGTMGPNHEAYNFSKIFNLETFPDYIFTFGDYWKDNTRFPIKKENIRSVGWPYHEKKFENSKKNSLKGEKQNILFISQGNIGNRLSKVAIELESIIDLDNYHIIYKLHPGESSTWKTDYPWLVNSNITVVDKQDKDMAYYYSISKYQIGVNSTALYEGLGYDLITMIVKVYGYDSMLDLIDKGYAELVLDHNDIYGIILTNKDKNIVNNIDYIWKNNSLENMIVEIDHIIQKNTNK